MKTVYQLREAASSKPTKVDWTQGIIFGVKVLAETSRNGFIYPLATRQKAHKLLENLRVNIDHLAQRHKGEDVPVSARFGKLINVREGAGGTYADLKFNIKHREAESIGYAAEHLDDTLGMSINGIGYGSRKDAQGRKIVDEIKYLKSCDVVADPGSTYSLFESANMELSEEVLAAAQGTDEAAILTALEAILAKRKAPAPVVTPVVESLSEEEQLARLKAEKDCLVLCESLKVAPTIDLIGMMADLPTEEKRKALALAMKKAPGAPPKSAPVVLRESAPAVPTDPAALRTRAVGILRGGN